MRRVFFLLLGMILFTLACRNQSNNPQTKPGPVWLVTAAPDTAWNERGIDALPEGNAIYLAWVPDEDGLAAEFEVWRGQASGGSMTLLATAAAHDTAHVDDSVALYTRYTYMVRAVSDEGDHSEPSDTLSYLLLGKAQNLAATAEAVPTFSWEDPNVPPEGNYFIRVMETATQRRIWSAVVPSAYTGGRESVRFNADGGAVQATLQAGTAYQWRIDILGSESHSGSESPWIPFSIQ